MAKRGKHQFSIAKTKIKYDPVHAYWLSECAKLAYKDTKSIKARARKWGLGRVNSIRRNNTQCFVASNDRVVIVAFAGTDFSEIEDIVADVDVRLVSGYGGKVHAGFDRAYRFVRSRVRDQVAAHARGGKTVWLTGHSLGGALATLAALDLRGQKRTVKGVYTYAPPRVGNKAFSRNFNTKLGDRAYHLARVTDPVPTLPGPPFVPVPTRIHITSRDALTLRYKASKNLLNLIENAVEAPSSHGVVSYVKAMEKNTAKNPFDTPDRVVRERTILKPKDVEKEIEKGLESAGKTIGGFVKKLF